MNLVAFKFIFLVVTSLVFASPGPNESIHQICEDLQSARSELHATSRGRMIWELLKIKIAPGSMVHTQTQRLPIPGMNRVSAPSDDDQSYLTSENLIFSFAPTTHSLNSVNLASLRIRHAELKRKLKRQLPQLRKIALAANVNRCIFLAERSNFDFVGLVKLAEEVTSLQILDQIDDSRKTNRRISKTIRKLNLSWQLVTSTDLMDLHRLLAHSTIKNLIIVGHGSPDGQLIDSNFNEYPSRFFSSLPPTLQSISIFACHANKIVKTLELQKALLSNDSIHAERRLFFPLGTQLIGTEN